jgi:hypothetical protein
MREIVSTVRISLVVILRLSNHGKLESGALYSGLGEACLQRRDLP